MFYRARLRIHLCGRSVFAQIWIIIPAFLGCRLLLQCSRCIPTCRGDSTYVVLHRQRWEVLLLEDWIVLSSWDADTLWRLFLFLISLVEGISVEGRFLLSLNGNLLKVSGYVFYIFEDLNLRPSIRSQKVAHYLETEPILLWGLVKDERWTLCSWLVFIAELGKVLIYSDELLKLTALLNCWYESELL